MGDPLPLVIVGGGLAGAFAALRLSALRPELPFLLIEQEDRIGGNHIWSFFDSDIPSAARELVSALEPVRWPRHRVRFENRARVLPAAYNSVRSEALDRLVRVRIAPDRLRLGRGVKALAPTGVVLSDGEQIRARAVIDARGPQGAMPGLDTGWQKFVGIEFAAKHAEPDCATVMDATVAQRDGYRFVYVLPLTGDRVLVEDTYYSDTSDLDVALVAAQVRELADERGLAGPELRMETGVLPILLGGRPELFWPEQDRVARLGLAGGFFHATTGYSFGLALRLADQLAQLPGTWTAAELAGWSRARFLEHWGASRFYRMLNRMLFRAAGSAQRDRVFAHFYRLDEELIARFYAGSLTLGDKARILSGKPPVPVGAAIKAILDA